MTSNRQRTANQANSRSSTGPKSVAGKARSAGNSRRHGLTARPDRAQVRGWLRVILDDPSALVDPFERDPLRRAALDLAEAEAQLARVRLEEEKYFLNPQGDPSEAEKMMTEERTMIRNALGEAAQEREFYDRTNSFFLRRSLQTPREYELWRRAGYHLLLRMRASHERATQKRIKSQEKLGRTLARYRASAEARRRAALRRFISEITKRTQFLGGVCIAC